MGKDGFTFVSLRMKDELVEKLDDLKWINRTDRSKEIIRACEFIVTSIECPRCGTINAKNSVACSVCNENLRKYDEIKTWVAVDKYKQEYEKTHPAAESEEYIVCKSPARGFGLAKVKDYDTDKQETIEWVSIDPKALEKIRKSVTTDEVAQSYQLF